MKQNDYSGSICIHICVPIYIINLCHKCYIINLKERAIFKWCVITTKEFGE